MPACSVISKAFFIEEFFPLPCTGVITSSFSYIFLFCFFFRNLPVLIFPWTFLLNPTVYHSISTFLANIHFQRWLRPPQIVKGPKEFPLRSKRPQSPEWEEWALTLPVQRGHIVGPGRFIVQINAQVIVDITLSMSVNWMLISAGRECYRLYHLLLKEWISK